MKHIKRLALRPSKKWAALAVVPAIVIGGLAAQSAWAYQRYYTTIDGLALRSGPGTQYSVVQRVNKNTPLDIACQMQGGTNVNGNATWDRLTGGQWVTDYYTTTPSWNS